MESRLSTAPDSFKPQALSNTLWALATLGYDGVELYKAAERAAAQPAFAQTATTQNTSNLLYGFALVGYQPEPGLLRGWSWEGANAQGCANSLWALAWLRLWEQELVQPLARRLQQLLREDAGQDTAQGLANSVWALAVMGPEALVRHTGLVEALLLELARRWQAEPKAFPAEALAQLWQVQQELQTIKDSVTAQRLRAILPAVDGGKLWAAMYKVVSGSRRGTDESRLQRSVAAGLGRLQQALDSAPAGGLRILSVDTEVVLEGVLGPADVVVQVRQEAADGSARQWRVAVEVDGPWHFLLNKPKEVDGTTALRNRQLWRTLRAEGGRLLCVPHWEWTALKGKVQEVAYLRAQVLEAAV